MQALGMPGHLIRRLHQHSTQIFASHIRDAGLDVTSVQFAAMDVLFAKPGIDQATIAASIACDRATTGAVIDRLATKGLVERTNSQKDRRSKIVRLTEPGKHLYQSLLAVVQKVQVEMLEPLTHNERARFLALAEKVVGNGQFS
jgi:DNA-binding MarR family transcriptional regulator